MSNANMMRAALKVIEANVARGWPPFHGLDAGFLRAAINGSKQPGGWFWKVLKATNGTATP